MLPVHHWRAMALLLAIAAVGCSKEDLTGALDKAKNAVTEGTEKVKQVAQEKMDAAKVEVEEQLSLAGSFELTVGEELTTKACYLRIIPGGAGRSTVLQLQSYRDVDHETFPSVFLQAQVQANSLADLLGEPLSARLFVQREDQGPVLFSDASTPIKFKITAVKDNMVSAELTSGTLRETTTGTEIPVTGKLTGVVE